MDTIRKKYLVYATDKNFLISFLVSLALLFVSLVINYYAGQYATGSESNPVTDIILSNTRVYDVDFIFIYGSVLFWIFIGFLCLFDPKKMPFTFKTIALFVIVRSIFISLTHIAPFPSHLVLDPSKFISYFTFGGDLFFSGHTGLPFLMALVFWKNFWIRILNIAVSILFGITVLLGHLHYSIDVLSAYFITYGIFHMSEIFFKKDWAMSDSEQSSFSD